MMAADPTDLTACVAVGARQMSGATRQLLRLLIYVGPSSLHSLPRGEVCRLPRQLDFREVLVSHHDEHRVWDMTYATIELACRVRRIIYPVEGSSAFHRNVLKLYFVLKFSSVTSLGGHSVA
jgi:hypothetical protein